MEANGKAVKRAPRIMFDQAEAPATPANTKRNSVVTDADQKIAGSARVTITAPKLVVGAFLIRGVAPLVTNRFSNKAREIIRAQQAAGTSPKRGKVREPKDFDDLFRQAMHTSPDGWHGIPASAFRNALISACRLADFRMTLAKLSVFVVEDGYDADGVTPLVRITKGEPKPFEMMVRNASGVCDIRSRPMWAPGWEATVRIRFDADQFKLADVANLLLRVGMQVGLCEGRPDSKDSAGLGWGLFEIANSEGGE